VEEKNLSSDPFCCRRDQRQTRNTYMIDKPLNNLIILTSQSRSLGGGCQARSKARGSGKSS